MIISSRYSSTVRFISPRIGDELVSCNLGFIFDSCMNFAKHVNSIVRNSFSEIRKLSMIRKNLNRETTETVLHAFVSSKLDYCNIFR